MATAPDERNSLLGSGEEESSVAKLEEAAAMEEAEALLMLLSQGASPEEAAAAAGKAPDTTEEESSVAKLEEPSSSDPLRAYIPRLSATRLVGVILIVGLLVGYATNDELLFHEEVTVPDCGTVTDCGIGKRLTFHWFTRDEDFPQAADDAPPPKTSALQVEILSDGTYRTEAASAVVGARTEAPRKVATAEVKAAHKVGHETSTMIILRKLYTCTQRKAIDVAFNSNLI